MRPTWSPRSASAPGEEPCMLQRVGGQRAGPGPPKVQSPFSFCSEAQDGLQKFWMVRAGTQTPEEVGSREAGELPLFFP